MKVPISVCILARNEEKYIGECIQSVNDLVKEVIVLDTGSTDRTPEISAAEGAKVTSSFWNNDFGEARNKLISMATQPYILMLDADERLINHNNINFVEEIFSLESFPHKAGRVEISNEVVKDRIVKAHIIRLFANIPEFRYSGRIHEQLLYMGCPPETFSTNIKLFHYGYSEQAIFSKDKIKRNLQLLELQLGDNEEDPYILFQIGKTYSVNKQNDMALQYLEQAYKYSDNSMSYQSNIIRSLAWIYLKSKRWGSLVSLLEEALTIYPDYTDLYYIYGSALIEMKSIEAFNLIPGAFRKCLELGEPDPGCYETEHGVGTFLAHYNLGLYYELSMKLDEARYHYLISSESGFKPATARLAQLS